LNLNNNTDLEPANFAVIGDPIEHSLSPLMHNAAFKYLGLNAKYQAIHVKKEELANFAREAEKKYKGVNVTVPHKNSIINHIHSVSKLAKIAESVNTIINKNGKLFGETTDGRGLELAIKDIFSINVKNKNIFFIGCGGAARAVAIYFASIGVKSLFLTNRTIFKAQKTAELIKNNFPDVDTSFCSINDITTIKKNILKSDIIIQSTTLGLKKDDQSPLPEEFFFNDKIYYDMVYADTEFIKFAKRNKCPVANGLSMLIYQGAESFKLWTGIEAPVQIMKEAILNRK